MVGGGEDAKIIPVSYKALYIDLKKKTAYDISKVILCSHIMERYQHWQDVRHVADVVDVVVVVGYLRLGRKDLEEHLRLMR